MNSLEIKLVKQAQKGNKDAFDLVQNCIVKCMVCGNEKILYQVDG